MQGFAFIGVLVLIGVGLLGMGYVIGRITDDGDMILPWVISTLIAAVSLAARVMQQWQG